MRKIYQKKSQLFYVFVLGFRLNVQFAFTFGLILPFSLVRILTTKKLKSGHIRKFASREHIT
mgnify:CR=1 FL=1